MKRFFFLLFFSSIIPSLIFSQSNFVFGVKPGLKMNSAFVGIKQNKILVFVGTSLIWTNADGKYEESHDNYSSISKYSRSITSVDFSGNAFLIVPQIGLKYYFNKKAARPYIFSSLFIGLPIVDLNSEGYKETREYDNNQLVYSERKTATLDNLKDIEKAVNEALGFWGVCIGGGAEYFFSPEFSIGGEYGIRMIFDSAKYESETIDTNDSFSNGYRDKTKTEVSAALQMSYAVLTLNFYF